MFSEEITANQEARWRAFGLKTSHANDPNSQVYQRAPVLGHCSPVGCGMLLLPCFPSSCLCVLRIQTPHPGLRGHMFSRLGWCWHDSATAQDSKVQSASSAQFHDPVTEAVTASRVREIQRKSFPCNRRQQRASFSAEGSPGPRQTCCWIHQLRCCMSSENSKGQGFPCPVLN